MTDTKRVSVHLRPELQEQLEEERQLRNRAAGAQLFPEHRPRLVIEACLEGYFRQAERIAKLVEDLDTAKDVSRIRRGFQFLKLFGRRHG